MFTYVTIFLAGMVVTGIGLWTYSAYLKWRDNQAYIKETLIKDEKDGWIKIDKFSNWSTRKNMIKWRENIKSDLEMSIWLEENTKGEFRTEFLYGNRYVKFNKDEDGVAFKLRWS